MPTHTHPELGEGTILPYSQHDGTATFVTKTVEDGRELPQLDLVKTADLTPLPGR